MYVCVRSYKMHVRRVSSCECVFACVHLNNLHIATTAMTTTTTRFVSWWWATSPQDVVHARALKMCAWERPHNRSEHSMMAGPVCNMPCHVTTSTHVSACCAACMLTTTPTWVLWKKSPHFISLHIFVRVQARFVLLRVEEVNDGHFACVDFGACVTRTVAQTNCAYLSMCTWPVRNVRSTGVLNVCIHEGTRERGRALAQCSDFGIVHDLTVNIRGVCFRVLI